MTDFEKRLIRIRDGKEAEPSFEERLAALNTSLSESRTRRTTSPHKITPALAAQKSARDRQIMQGIMSGRTTVSAPSPSANAAYQVTHGIATQEPSIQQQNQEGFSRSEFAKGIIHKGLAEANYALNDSAAALGNFAANALDAVVPGLGGGTDGSRSYADTLRDWSAKTRTTSESRLAELRGRYQENVDKGGKIAQTIDKYGVSTVRAVPQALIAIATAAATGGGSAIASTADLAAQATANLSPHAGAVLANTIKTASTGLVKNPQYWTSFFDVLGGSYNQAIQDLQDEKGNLSEKDESRAMLYALGNSLLNAAVEIGGETGGIQGLPAQLQKGGTSALRTWVDGMVDEGKEEVAQGILERAMQNLVYNRGNAIASTTDENAVLNPRTATEEFIGGAVVGGVLGGGQIGINAGLNALSGRRGVSDPGVTETATPGGAAVAESADTMRAENPDAHVLGATAAQVRLAFPELSLEKVERRAAIIDRLIEGKAVPDRHIQSIDPTNAKIRDIIYRNTGVQISGNTAEAVRQLKSLPSAVRATAEARETAAEQEQAARDEQARQELEEEIAQADMENSLREIQENPSNETRARQEEAVGELNQLVDNIDVDADGNPLVSYADAIRGIFLAAPWVDGNTARQIYQDYRDSTRTALFGGQRLTRAQFAELLKSIPEESRQGIDADALYNTLALEGIDGQDNLDRYLPAQQPETQQKESMGEIQPVFPALAERGAVTGAEGRTYADSDKPIQYTWAAVPVDALVISHDEYGGANTNYPTELQPRDRSRSTSQQQIQKMSQALNPDLLAESPLAQNGAPIIREDGAVIGGNARSAAIRAAYEKGRGAEYADYIRQNAARFGLDPDALPENPVLVRVAQGVDDWAGLARDLNAGTTAAYSTTETAQSDAERMADVLQFLVPNDSGDLNTRDNKQFIGAFLQTVPESERAALRTGDGLLSQAGLDRAVNAVLQYAYDDSDIVQRVTESLDNDVKNITNALVQAAPGIAALKSDIQSGEAYDIPVVDAITSGFKLFQSAKSGNITVQEALDQADMLSNWDENAALVASVMERHTRSARAVRAFLNDIIDEVRALGGPNQPSLFGGESTDAEGVFDRAAIRTNEREHTDFRRGGESGGQFGLFAEARGEAGADGANRQTTGDTGTGTGGAEVSGADGTGADAGAEPGTAGEVTEAQAGPEPEADPETGRVYQNEDEIREALNRGELTEDELVEAAQEAYGTEPMSAESRARIVMERNQLKALSDYSKLGLHGDTITDTVDTLQKLEGSLYGENSGQFKGKSVDADARVLNGLSMAYPDYINYSDTHGLDSVTVKDMAGLISAVYQNTDAGNGMDVSRKDFIAAVKKGGEFAANGYVFKFERVGQEYVDGRRETTYRGTVTDYAGNSVWQGGFYGGKQPSAVDFAGTMESEGYLAARSYSDAMTAEGTTDRITEAVEENEPPKGTGAAEKGFVPKSALQRILDRHPELSEKAKQQIQDKFDDADFRWQKDYKRLEEYAEKAIRDEKQKTAEAKDAGRLAAQMAAGRREAAAKRKGKEAVQKARREEREKAKEALQKQKEKYEGTPEDAFPRDRITAELMNAARKEAAAKRKGEERLQNYKDRTADRLKRIAELKELKSEEGKLGRLMKRAERMGGKTTRENQKVINAALQHVSAISTALKIATANEDVQSGTASSVIELDRIYHELVDLNIAEENTEVSALFNEIASYGERFRAWAQNPTATQTEVDTEMLSNVNKGLRYIMKQIRDSDKIIRAGRREAVRTAADSIFRRLNTTPKISDNPVSRYILASSTPMNVIRRMSDYDETSPWYRLWDDLNEGTHTEQSYKYEATDIFSDFFDNRNKAFTRWMENAVGRKAEKIMITGMTADGETTVAIDPLMKVSLAAAYLDGEQSIRHIERGGVYIPDFDTYHKSGRKNKGTQTHIQISRGTLQEIYRSLTEPELALIRKIEQYNKLATSRVNDVSEQTVGYPKYGERTDGSIYWHIASNVDYTRSEAEAVKADRSIEGAGRHKERVRGASNPINLIPADIAIRESIRDDAHYVGLAVPIRNIKKVMNYTTFYDSGVEDVDAKMEEGTTSRPTLSFTDKSVRAAFREKFSDSTMRYVDKVLSDIEIGRSYEQGALDAVTSNLAASTLTLNARVGALQFASYFTAADVLGWGPVIRALADIPAVVSGRAATDSVIDKNTPLHRMRREGYSTKEIGDLAERDDMIARGLKKASFLNFTQGMDIFTTRLLWATAERYVEQHNQSLRRGSPEFNQETARIYNRTIEDTQPNYSTMHRTGFQRSGDSLTRNIIGMYKTVPFQMGNLVGRSIGDVSAKARLVKGGGDEAKKEFAKAVGHMLLTLSAVIASQGAVTGLRRIFNHYIYKNDSAYQDENGGETTSSVISGMAKDFVSGLAGMAPGGSEAYAVSEALYESIRGNKPAFGDKLLESFTAEGINDLEYNIMSLIESVSNQENGRVIVLNAKKTTEKMSALLGIPQKNITDNLLAGARAVWTATDGKYLGEYRASLFQKNPVSSGNGYRFAYQALAAGELEQYDAIVKDMSENWDTTPSKIRNRMLKMAENYKSQNGASGLPQKSLSKLGTVEPEEKEEKFSVDNMTRPQKNAYEKEESDTYIRVTDEMQAGKQYANIPPEAQSKMMDYAAKYAAETSKANNSGGKYVIDTMDSLGITWSGLRRDRGTGDNIQIIKRDSGIRGRQERFKKSKHN